MIVHENNKYKVQIGKSIHNEGDINCYQIVNKEYGVIEAETTMLPSAIATADDLADSLEEQVEENEAEEAEAPTLQ